MNIEHAVLDGDSIGSRATAWCAAGRNAARTSTRCHGILLRHELEAVVVLAPVGVVDVVVVIAGARHANLEEIIVAGRKQRGRGEEPAAGVTVDADFVDVDPLVARGKLLDAGL